MTKNNLRDSTSIPTFTQGWRYERVGGQRTNEFIERSLPEMANDFVYFAKRRLAAESRPRPSHEPDFNADEAIRLFKEWLCQPIVLESPQHSVAGQVIPADAPIEAHYILVQHDWAALMANSEVTGPGKAPPPLPYPLTAFEFAFKGGVRAVLILLEGIEGPESAKLFFRTKAGWINAKYREDQPLGAPLVPGSGIVDKGIATADAIIWKNVHALCVVLDAQLVETTATREPYRRNEPPRERGPLPMYSYHTVSLVNRHRVAPLRRPGDEPTHRKRLHFRRGHWRHYATHRTWIKWTLVGNPDLGFVDKEYRL